MSTVRFFPSERSVEVPEGLDLVAAAKRAGVRVDAPCGGAGTCGKCLVRLRSGSVQAQGHGMLPEEMRAEGWTLACRTKVGAGLIEVELPQALVNEQGQFGDEAAEHRLVREERFPHDWQYEPLTIKWRLSVPPAGREDGLSDLDRLQRALKREWGEREVVCSLPCLRHLAEALRAQAGLVTVTLLHEGQRLRLLRIEPGDHCPDHLGIAVDVGTTTVAVHLVNLANAKVLVTRSAYNRQVACGLDVISRIAYARRPGGLDELRSAIIGTVNTLVGEACSATGFASAAITSAVISGNTTMTHLLLGLPPEQIRLDPYTPTLHEVPDQRAADLGLDLDPEARVLLSPAVGSYVGGDITAGMLCTDLADQGEAPTLFIDIGTNGELALGNRDFILACACSAGPAFEGGGIECGMRASVGAIERVAIDPVSGEPSVRTIGGVRARGICGSGLIDLVANLFRGGWIDQAGRFDRRRVNPHLDASRANAVYTIVAGEGGPAVTISERDLENLIRAKAAIYSACALLVAHAGLEFADLAAVQIAGGFGRYLDLDQAITIGLLPDLPRERFRYLGNTSLTGSYMVLVSREFRQRQLELSRRITYLDLSADPGYMDQYTSAMFLPHTDRQRFPSVPTPPSAA